MFFFFGKYKTKNMVGLLATELEESPARLMSCRGLRSGREALVHRFNMCARIRNMTIALTE